MQEPISQPPKPGLRRGPRPLLLHLALAAMKSSGSPDAWPSSNEDWQSLIARLGPHAAPKLADADLIHGIACYRRHPAHRELEDPPVIWQQGESRLLDFGGDGPAPPLLLVPSLVNRATILDLTKTHSMARHLARLGLHVFLLDWGWPDAEARRLDLDAVITGRLAQAIRHIAAEKVTLAGYCMGGLLTLAAAQLQPERIAGLALLATPWNFHAARATAELDTTKLMQMLEPLMQLTGTLSVDALQLLFTIGDPNGVGDKYRAFGQTDQNTDRARQFVAIEDWLNDGIPLAAPIARQCLRQWYGENAPARGTWQIAGQAIRPESLDIPSFVAIPGRDRIVPPESALPLAATLKHATVIRPAAGHVGMVAGANAAPQLWTPLATWALNLPGSPAGFRKRARSPRLPR